MNVFLLLLPTLIFYILIPLLLLFIVVRFLKRKESRAMERIKVEKNSLSIHKQQMTIINDLSERLQAIEKMLKEVD